MKGAFSTPVCARKQTSGPPVIDQRLSTGSCNCHHALSGRAVDPPTSPNHDSCDLSLSCSVLSVENKESEVSELEGGLETVEPYQFEGVFPFRLYTPISSTPIVSTPTRRVHKWY